MTARAVDPVRRARAYLLRVAEPPAPALAAFVAARGPVETAELVRAGQTPPGVREETAARRAHDRVEEDLAAAEQGDARLVIPEDDEWPTSRLQALDLAATGWRWAVAPLGLWVRGSVRLGDVVNQSYW
jgi:DNA processing protein